jgi:hypothetical protein
MLAPSSSPDLDPRASGAVQVLPVGQLKTIEEWPAGTRLVVDATWAGAPSLPMLARVARVCRQVRAAGGDLVLAASAATVELLRSSGLHKTIPYRADVSTALACLDPVQVPG